MLNKIPTYRIETLNLRGFRQYVDAHFDFGIVKDGEPDFHIIVGKMGAGKTTIMRAVSYLLYGVEYDDTTSLERLPIGNLYMLNNEKRIQASVSMRVSSDTEEWDVWRKRWLLKDSHGIFEGEETKSVVNKITGEEEDFSRWVSSFIPPKLSRFFFFDGEALETYFEADRRKDVEDTIKTFLKYAKLEKLRTMLDELVREYRSTISLKDGQLRQMNEQLNDYEREKDRNLELLAKMKKDLSNYKKELQEVSNILRTTSNIAEKMKRKETLEEVIKLRSKELKEKQREYADLVVSALTSALALPYMEQFDAMIREKNTEVEFIPGLDAVIKQSIISQRCMVCGEELDDNKVEMLKDKLQKIERYGDQERIKGYFAVGFSRVIDLLENAPDKIRLLARHIEDLDSSIRQDTKERRSLLNEIKKYQTSKVNKAAKREEELRERIPQLEKDIENVQKKIKDIQKKIDRIKRNVAKVERKIEGIDDKILYKTVLEKLRDKLGILQNRVLEDTVRELSEYATEIVKRLMWKDTFSKVEIGKDFSIKIYDNEGNNVIGSLSGGEREVLSLAYTMAIHEVMGIHSPMIIDRPTSNISGESLEYTLNVLTEIAKERQIIVMFTTAEWDGGIKDIVWDKAKSIYYLNHDPSTKTTTLNQLKDA